MTTDATYLDGNAAAGALSEVFTMDVTAAITRCNGCGHTAVFAESRVYVNAPGLVARCAGCDEVLLRVVTTPSDVYVDLRGLTYLRLPNP